MFGCVKVIKMLSHHGWRIVFIVIGIADRGKPIIGIHNSHKIVASVVWMELTAIWYNRERSEQLTDPSSCVLYNDRLFMTDATKLFAKFWSNFRSGCRSRHCSSLVQTHLTSTSSLRLCRCCDEPDSCQCLFLQTISIHGLVPSAKICIRKFIKTH